MEHTRYTTVAIAFHWVIAALIILQLGTGLVFGFDLIADKSILFPLMQFHKSLGLTILVLSLLRLFWRLGHKPPPYPTHMKPWEKFAAHATHALLYFLMIFIPLSGWALVSSSAMGFPTIWFNLFQWPNIPGLENLPDATKGMVHEVSEESHGLMAYAMIFLLFLHVGAALKHHFFDRDEVLHHMIPFLKPKKTIGLFLALAFLSASPAQAAVWTVDKAKSAIEFSGENAGTAFTGKFEEWDASIDFDPAHPEKAAIKVTIKTGSAKTGTMTFDSTLPKHEWFDAEKYPDAVFVAKKVTAKDAENFEVMVSLTIKETTQDVTFPFTLKKIDDKTSEMAATLSLDRVAFDVGKKADATGEWVSKEIPLKLHVTATQK